MDKHEIYEYLAGRNIWHEITEHKAVYNMAELSGIDVPYPEADAKNLFVRDDKKRDFYLITVKGHKRVDLKEFRKNHHTRALSFALGDELRSMMNLVQHCTNNSDYSTCYLRQYRVVVSQQCHRIASFLRLVLTQISGTVFHCYLCNAVLAAGSVTPLGILNDTEVRVKVFIDRDFLEPPNLIGVHPNDNTATVWLKTDDLISIIREHGNPVEIAEL